MNWTSSARNRGMSVNRAFRTPSRAGLGPSFEREGPPPVFRGAPRFVHDEHMKSSFHLTNLTPFPTIAPSIASRTLSAQAITPGQASPNWPRSQGCPAMLPCCRTLLLLCQTSKFHRHLLFFQATAFNSTPPSEMMSAIQFFSSTTAPFAEGCAARTLRTRSQVCPPRTEASQKTRHKSSGASCARLCRLFLQRCPSMSQTTWACP